MLGGRDHIKDRDSEQGPAHGSIESKFGNVVARLLLSVPTSVLVSTQLVTGSSIQAGLTTPYGLSATTLFMGGTGQPMIVPADTPEFIGLHAYKIYNRFVGPSGLCAGGEAGCTQVAVYTPESLAPLIGDLPFGESVAVGRQLLDNCVRGVGCIATPAPFTTTGTQVLTDTSYVIVGESQSAVISSHEKADLIANPATERTISFILLSNQNRPNGGVLERFVGAYWPLLDIRFNGATPTNSPRSAPMITVDIAGQYDGWSDFPNNPLNLLASLNALMGTVFLHPAMLGFGGSPELQGQYEDTTYYLQPTRLLPLLVPTSRIPVIGHLLALALDAPLRVLVETGYDRTINPGMPTPANFCYFPNPVETLLNLAVAIPTGWDDAVAYLAGDPANRPFRTSPQPIYGVGGPPVNAGAVDPYGPPIPAAAITPVPLAVSADASMTAAAPTSGSRGGLRSAADSVRQPQASGRFGRGGAAIGRRPPAPLRGNPATTTSVKSTPSSLGGDGRSGPRSEAAQGVWGYRALKSAGASPLEFRHSQLRE